MLLFLKWNNIYKSICFKNKIKKEDTDNLWLNILTIYNRLVFYTHNLKEGSAQQRSNI